MSKQLIQSYPLGCVTVFYFMETENQMIGFTIIPQHLEERFSLQGDWKMESLVQLKAVEDDEQNDFAKEHSDQNSTVCQKLIFEKQENTHEGSVIKIITTVANSCLRAKHIVTFDKGDEGIHIQISLENVGTAIQKIEMLSCFSICNVFPFEEQERIGDCRLHRMRSALGGKVRLETHPIELQLKRSFKKYGLQSISYGQAGTIPVQKYLPGMILEDTKYHCFIGASIAWSGVAFWNMEVFTEYGRPSVFGCLTGRKSGHSMKNLTPGEVFITPEAFLTACIGKSDWICKQLTNRMKRDENPLIS